MKETNLPWVKESILPWKKLTDSYVVIVDPSAYSVETVMKTCYLFLDQCYLFVEPEGEDKIKVYFTPLNSADNMLELIGEFSNRLIWQETRSRVAAETQAIKELIVAQAFSEANIISGTATAADYNLDPTGIAK